MRTVVRCEFILPRNTLKPRPIYFASIAKTTANRRCEVYR
jgi:hypothetical protein